MTISPEHQNNILTPSSCEDNKSTFSCEDNQGYLIW